VAIIGVHFEEEEHRQSKMRRGRGGGGECEGKIQQYPAGRHVPALLNARHLNKERDAGGVTHAGLGKSSRDLMLRLQGGFGSCR